uniref:Uncharacterized protein n=1 Tax=Clytia hemisphaerica TaxID=252671 RepID=A0A7M5UYV1_9CNID
MEEVFKSFCSFGAGKDGAALMDNSKFAKLARDLKLLDKKLTATDVDIIFNRTEVKPKRTRKIRYEQFMLALQYMASKKYPGDEEGFQKLQQVILKGCGPKEVKTTKSTNKDVVGRLTDTTKYTGSHRERFDEDGTGKGLGGRYATDATTQNALSGYVGAYKGKDTYDEVH